ncbi:hypothetical protein TNCV_1320121 [Trichonephila clavipes]|nr:hypothetical protein TNCV_1320121 [Trichonephila clavipes]
MMAVGSLVVRASDSRPEGLAVALSTKQLTVRFSRFHLNFEVVYPLRWSGTFHLFFPSTNLTRGLVTRRLFRVPPFHKGIIHLQTSMPSPGCEPRPYGTAVSVTSESKSIFTALYVKVSPARLKVWEKGKED